MKDRIKAINYKLIISVLLVITVLLSVVAVALNELVGKKPSTDTDAGTSSGQASSVTEIVEKSPLKSFKSISVVPGEDFLIDDLTPESALDRAKAVIDTVKSDGFDSIELRLNFKDGLLFEVDGFSAPMGDLLPDIYRYAHDKSIKVIASVDLRALAQNSIADSDDIGKICTVLSSAKLGQNADMLVFENCYLTESDISKAEYEASGSDVGYERYLNERLNDAMSQYYISAAKAKATLYTGIGYDAAVLPENCVCDIKYWIENGFADFVTVSDPYSTAAENPSFTSYLENAANLFGENADIFCKIAYYNLGSELDGWEQTDQILHQLKALDTLGIDGFVIDGYIDFKEDTTESKTAVRKYLLDLLTEGYIMRELSVTKPEKNTFTTTSDTVLLSGASDPEFKLLLNGEELERSELGYFSTDLSLKDGLNTFILEHKGVSETYKITYKRTVIQSISPTKKTSLPSQSTLLVSCVAISGSTVTAKLGSTSVTLQEDPILDENGQPKGDYSNYYGSITLPAAYDKDVTLGKVTFTAKSKYGTETESGGNIVILKEDIPDSSSSESPSSSSTQSSSSSSAGASSEGSSSSNTSSTGTTSSTSSGTTSSGGTTSSSAPTGGSAWVMPSNGKYVDVGNTYIAEVVNWQAETLSSTDNQDFSRPTNNYLPQGTVDYCSAGIVSTGSVSMRTLRYGNNLYVSSKGLKYIDVTKGTLPDHNTVGVGSVTNTGRHTQITLDVLWKAPFRLDIAPQKYTSLGNSNKRGDYTIESSTFEYIDITFCYTTLVEGSVVIPESDPVFSKAEWIKNEADYTLRLHLKKKGVFYGWSAEYNENGQLVFSFLNPARIVADQSNSYGYRLDGLNIVIDVGHGGSDVGATGSNKNYTEKVLNLILAEKLKFELESLGAKVYMTRTDDSNPSSDERMKLLRTVKADFCIAIHRNATDSSTPSAFNSYHFNAFSADAAKIIYNTTEKADLYEKTKWSGTKWHYFYTCRQTDCPVVLTENGFMTNPEEYSKMIDDEFNNKCAKALAQGIVNYFASIQ